MQSNLTRQFAAARHAWEAAYASHDAIASDPDPMVDRSAEANAAGDLEHETLLALLKMPAATPAEIGEKMRIMRSRGVDEGWTDYYPDIIAQIDRDLIEQQRPCVSRDIAKAFEGYAASRILDAECEDTSDEAGLVHMRRTRECFNAALALPCAAPGDFMLKAYLEAIDGSLGAYETIRVPEGVAAVRWHEIQFDPAEIAPDSQYGEVIAMLAMVDDLAACDLGRCLLALGRVDFDADAWLGAAERAQMPVNLVIQVDGSKGLWTGQRGGEITPLESGRWDACMALLGAGMGSVGADRRRAIGEAIEARHPALIFDARKAGEIVA